MGSPRATKASIAEQRIRASLSSKSGSILGHSWQVNIILMGISSMLVCGANSTRFWG